MKKGIVVLSSVVALMLLSFASPQEKKAVRLKNGNYLLNDLKMDKNDVKAIQELAEEMSNLFEEKHGRNEKEKIENGRTKHRDLMTIFESSEGWKAVAAFGNEEEHYVLTEEIGSDMVKTILALRFGDKDKDEEKESLMGRMDDIMRKFL